MGTKRGVGDDENDNRPVAATAAPRVAGLREEDKLGAGGGGSGGGEPRRVAIEFSAGALAGFLADIVTYPFDTLRTLFIVSPSSETFGGVLRAAGGVAGLFRGFSVVALFTLPSHAIYFGAYEFAKRRFLAISEAHLGSTGGATASAVDGRAHRAGESGAYLAAGLVAELVASPLWTMQEVLKQREQIKVAPRSSRAFVGELAHSHDASLRQTVAAIVRREGWPGLFRGYTAGLLVYGPFASIYFAAFEHAKQWDLRRQQQQRRRGGDAPADESSTSPMLNGIIAGTSATVVTQPLEVVRTRIVVADRRSGIADAVRSVYRAEGARGFFRGMTSRVLWLAPSAALTIGAFDYFKRWTLPSQ